jgi:hypothetical protein
MNDSVKLHKVLQLIQSEYTSIFDAAHIEPRIYETLDGEEVSAKAALKTFQPIYAKIMRIIHKD